MPPLFVLIHSPLVGPATWQPVADALARRGHPALVPSLLHVADAEPPAWRQVAAAVAAAVPGDRPVVLVAHSNAGAFVPVIRQALGQPVAGAVFVDALLPAAGREAQDVHAGQVGRQPVARHRLVPDQHDRPVTLTGARDDLRRDRPGPFVALLDAPVPGVAVVGRRAIH